MALQGVDVFGRKRLIADRIGKLHDGAKSLEAIKAQFGLAPRQSLDGLAEGSVLLTKNGTDFCRFESSVLLQEPQGIAPLNRRVLAAVTGEHDAGLDTLGQGEDPPEGRKAQQTRLIDPEHLATGFGLQLLIDEKTGDGLGL